MSHILPLQFPITKFNKKTERLILGYVRGIGITNCIIPSDIVELCITYYHSKLIVICIGDYMKIAELDSNKCYSTTITPLDGSINPFKFTNGLPLSNFECVVSYVEDFTLPTTVLNMNKDLNAKNIYSAIFQITDAYGGPICTAYIVDANAHDKFTIYDDEHIDLYHWPLPSPKYPLGHPPVGLYPLYSSKHGLVAIGKDAFARLQFNYLNKNAPHKWQDIMRLHNRRKHREYPVATFIDEDRFILCGGIEYHNVHSGGGSYYNSTLYSDIYDFNTDKWMAMSDMNSPRRSCGICFDGNNNKVYLGGGLSSSGSQSRVFECLDLKQNKWSVLGSCNKKHQTGAIIWTDGVHANVVHIASSSSRVFEKMDLRENKWRIYTDKNKFKTVFGEYSRQSLKLSKEHSRMCM
eukprot:199770_1